MPLKKSTKSEKKINDGPKKNKSSYMFFCADERENIKKDNPDLSNKEIIVEMGVRWKLLKETEPELLKKYEDLAAEDKERFLKEKRKSIDNSLEEKSEPKSKKTKKVVIKEDNSDEDSVKEDKVKKTKVNGYINFCKATRETVKTQYPSLSPKEVTTELGRLWKELTNEEKESWKNV